MNVEEFYGQINGDYQEILSRLVTDDRIKRFLVKFLETDDMSALKGAWSNQNSEEIFTYSHRLKGIALNLSLNNFAKYTSELTEFYRNGPAADSMSASESFNNCCKEYELIEACINKLD